VDRESVVIGSRATLGRTSNPKEESPPSVTLESGLRRRGYLRRYDAILSLFASVRAAGQFLMRCRGLNRPERVHEGRCLMHSLCALKPE
jgi:hypothetical protein